MLDIGKAIRDAGGYFVPTQWQLRALIQEARIQDKQMDIELIRNGVALEPQPVRIELYDTYPSDSSSAAGTFFIRRGVIFGVRGHPELDDLDIDEFDTFVFEEKEYQVMNVNRHLIGQIQAEFEAVG